MSPTPARRRPGATSPIALPVHVEPVRTPATAPTVDESPAPQRPPRTTPRSAAVALTPAPDPKKSITTQIRTSLVLQSHSAVLRTASAGGPRSFAAFVDSAITRELARLADEFNDGAPFEMLEGEFRTGRPFGS